MKNRLLILMSLLLLFSSCGVLFFRNITCREYKLDAEQFWFQGDVLSEYVFVNKSSNMEKKFYLRDKWISHRENYFSDSGCDCHDMSSQLLIGEKDSIWMVSDSRYIEKNIPTTRESFAFKFDNTKDILNNENSVISSGSIIIGEAEIETKIFISDYGGSKTKITVGKGIGPIKIELSNSEIWEMKGIKIEKMAPKSEYRYMNNYCN
ncbi:hypothetical protein GCM10022393_26860 [Aquimarina addita]|uniref:Uncharacterized protein n=1 Tax=Aquimarina addita TaxID=870485 RepID=A0ABP6ULL3_9FLAO